MMTSGIKKTILLLAVASLGFSSCTSKTNPVAASAGDGGIESPYAPLPGAAPPTLPAIVIPGIKELQGPNTLFSPTNSTQAGDPGLTIGNFGSAGGAIGYSLGGVSTIYWWNPTPAPGFYEYATGGAGISTFATPINLVYLSPGVGGPNGDYTNDYYIRWDGSKGPNTDLDYTSLSLIFAGLAPPSSEKVDISGYTGFVFFARGHGNFSVSISAPGTATGQSGPYTGYNYYGKIFGTELKGDNDWTQITIFFSELTQFYGSAADINQVLQQGWGLQFGQEAPITTNFRLDLDYVVFF